MDRVERAEKLDHVTALRVKAPKRRPPSSIFLKDNVSIFSIPFLLFINDIMLRFLFLAYFLTFLLHISLLFYCIFLYFFTAYFLTFFLLLLLLNLIRSSFYFTLMSMRHFRFVLNVSFRQHLPSHLFRPTCFVKTFTNVGENAKTEQLSLER